MRTLVFVALCAFIGGTAIAQTEVPNVFQAGQPARASEVNENFAVVIEGIQQLENSTENDVSILQGEQAVQNDRIDALETVMGGVQVFSQGTAFARLVDVSNPWVTLISSTGYIFEVAPTTTLEQEVILYYLEPNCVNGPFSSLAVEGNKEIYTQTNGVVFGHGTLFGPYYARRGLNVGIRTHVSMQVIENGVIVCKELVPFVAIVTAGRVQPNDESITGVPDILPPKPYTIGAP